MKTYKFKIFGHQYESRVERRSENELTVSVNGQEFIVEMEGAQRVQSARPTPKVVRSIAVPEAGTKITAAPASSKGVNTIKSPLPGLILKVSVREGDKVKAGQTLIIMEAMKMQNSIQATIDGTVSKIFVKEGESVLEGKELAILE